jgi:hypothetical protein
MSLNTRSNVHFLLGSAVLVASGAFLHAASSRGYLRVMKKALPLRRPMVDFDQRALAPYQLITGGRLSPENEEELGTKEYLNWTLRPPAGPLGEPHIDLMVSYYTGLPDQVPHVAEECFHMGGWLQASDDTVEMICPRLAEATGKQGRRIETLDARRLSFTSQRLIGTRTWAYYTIVANGDFYPNRQLVRMRMIDPRDSHLYYSKVEVDIRAPSHSDLKALDTIANEVLDRVLAELVQSHWPLRGSERGEHAIRIDSAG